MRCKTSKISRFARRQMELRVGICAPRALEIRSRFSCWSRKIRFRGMGVTKPSACIWFRGTHATEPDFVHSIRVVRNCFHRLSGHSGFYRGLRQLGTPLGYDGRFPRRPPEVATNCLQTCVTCCPDRFVKMCRNVYKFVQTSAGLRPAPVLYKCVHMLTKLCKTNGTEIYNFLQIICCNFGGLSGNRPS
jgi:hypothetical protein